jgi:hypothetical protein
VLFFHLLQQHVHAIACSSIDSVVPARYEPSF